MDWSRQLRVTAIFLPICISRNFPWEQLNPWLIPHSLIRSPVGFTTFLRGCGAYKRRKAGNVKGRNLLAEEHAWQSQRSSFPPPVTGTNRSCSLTTSALLAAACMQQRRQFPSSASDTMAANTALSVWMHSSLQVTDGEGPTRGILLSSLELGTLSSLPVQSHPWSPGTPSDFTQQPEHAVMHRKV